MAVAVGRQAEIAALDACITCLLFTDFQLLEAKCISSVLHTFAVLHLTPQRRDAEIQIDISSD